MCVLNCPPGYHHLGGKCRPPCEYANASSGVCESDQPHQRGDYCVLFGFLCTLPITKTYVKLDGDGDCLEARTPCNSISDAYSLLRLKTRKILIMEYYLTLPSSVYPEDFTFGDSSDIMADISVVGASLSLECPFVCPTDQGSNSIIPIGPPSRFSSLSFISLWIHVLKTSVVVFDCRRGSMLLDHVSLFLDQTAIDVPVISSSGASSLSLVGVMFKICTTIVSPLVSCSFSSSLIAEYVNIPLIKDDDLSNFDGIILSLESVDTFIFSDSKYVPFFF
jgi:hypothetical protein